MAASEKKKLLQNNKRICKIKLAEKKNCRTEEPKEQQQKDNTGVMVAEEQYNEQNYMAQQL